MGATGGDDGAVPLDVGGDAWLGAYQLPRSDFAWTSAKTFDTCMVFLFVVACDSLGERAWRRLMSLKGRGIHIKFK